MSSRDFNFDQLNQMIALCKNTDVRMAENRTRLLQQIEFRPFQVNYTHVTRHLFASDGSYICYWKAPNSEIYIGGVRVASVDSTFIPNPSPVYDERLWNVYNDFVYMNLENLSSRTDENNELLTPKQVLSKVMSRLEKQILYDYASTHENQLIVVDGALWGSYTYDPVLKPVYREILGDEMFNRLSQHTSIKDLALICREKGHYLVGVSKDSHLKFEKCMEWEQAVKIAELQQFGENRNTYYTIVPQSQLDRQPMPQDEFQIGVIYAKLHGNAVKWHRIDYLIDDRFPLETDILPTLAQYAAYNRHYGSLHAPQRCDELAVQLRQRNLSTQRRLGKMLMQNNRFTFEEFMKGVTNVNGEIDRRSMHDFFDSTRRSIRHRVSSPTQGGENL